MLTGCPTSCPLLLLARLYSLNHGDDRFECRVGQKVGAKEETCALMPPASARAAPGLREPPWRSRTTEAVQARARASTREWKQTRGVLRAAERPVSATRRSRPTQAPGPKFPGLCHPGAPSASGLATSQTSAPGGGRRDAPSCWPPARPTPAPSLASAFCTRPT